MTAEKWIDLEKRLPSDEYALLEYINNQHKSEYLALNAKFFDLQSKGQLIPDDLRIAVMFGQPTFEGLYNVAVCQRFACALVGNIRSVDKYVAIQDRKFTDEVSFGCLQIVVPYLRYVLTQPIVRDCSVSLAAAKPPTTEKLASELFRDEDDEW